MAENVKFTSKFEHGYGTMFISGSEILAKSVSQLADFWAAYKYCVQDRYGISICANFYTIGTQVKCMFILNIAYADNKELNKNLYVQKFADTFRFWVIGFEQLLRSVLFDIEHADKHTEETPQQISERIFSQRVASLKLYISMYDDVAQQKINQLRAERKAADARRKAAARAKALQKATQQNQSHQD